MSLQHSIKQSVSLGKDVIWFSVWGGVVVVFFPLVAQGHYRCELGACSVPGFCARPGVLDQTMWSNGNLF